VFSEKSTRTLLENSTKASSRSVT